MSETSSVKSKTVIENWIKPPKLVTYHNATLISHEEDLLVCDFYFPKKYYTNDFYLQGEKVLEKGEMFRGRRYFYADRLYSLLEFYSDTGELKAYYFDLTLPAMLQEDSVLLLDIKFDFFVLADRKKFYLLDEDEFNEAVRCKMFSQTEIDACLRTVAFIKSALLCDNFERIFSDYEKSSWKEWARYREYMEQVQ